MRCCRLHVLQAAERRTLARWKMGWFLFVEVILNVEANLRTISWSFSAFPFQHNATKILTYTTPSPIYRNVSNGNRSIRPDSSDLSPAIQYSVHRKKAELTALSFFLAGRHMGTLIKGMSYESNGLLCSFYNHRWLERPGLTPVLKSDQVSSRRVHFLNI